MPLRGSCPLQRPVTVPGTGHGRWGRGFADRSSELLVGPEPVAGEVVRDDAGGSELADMGVPAVSGAACPVPGPWNETVTDRPHLARRGRSGNGAGARPVSAATSTAGEAGR